MRLLRRVGPIVVGIALDENTNGDTYRPIAHIHCLAREFPSISLALKQEVPNEYVAVQWHSSKLQHMVERLRAVACVPIEGDLSLGSLLDAYHEYIERPAGRYQVKLLEDLVLIPTWIGHLERAGQEHDHALRIGSGWPQSVFDREGGWEAWRTALSAMISPSSVQSTVASETKRHALEGLPAFELGAN